MYLSIGSNLPRFMLYVKIVSKITTHFINTMELFMELFTETYDMRWTLGYPAGLEIEQTRIYTQSNQVVDFVPSSTQSTSHGCIELRVPTKVMKMKKQ